MICEYCEQSFYHFKDNKTSCSNCDQRLEIIATGEFVICKSASSSVFGLYKIEQRYDNYEVICKAREVNGHLLHKKWFALETEGEFVFVRMSQDALPLSNKFLAVCKPPISRILGREELEEMVKNENL